MADTSTGALVPSVKTENTPPESFIYPAAVPAATMSGTVDSSPETAEIEETDLDKDFLCPICMGMIKDAFLTACGHSFCYMCIVTHLQNKSDCPCCSHYLTKSLLYPNFLLNKLLKKFAAYQFSKTAFPVEHLRLLLQQKDCEIPIKELDSLLSLIAEKKRNMEQLEAETNMQILMDFLHCLRKQKLEELKEVQTDLQYIKEDIHAVEKHREELYSARERSSVLHLFQDDRIAQWTADSRVFQGAQIDLNVQKSQSFQQMKDAPNGSHGQHAVAPSGLAVAKKRRIHAQFTELQECYLQKRRSGDIQLNRQEEKDEGSSIREGYHAGLQDFQSVLTTFTRYSRLRVIAELMHGDLFHSANIVSSIEFSRDDELFATAGVSKRIKVFEYSTVVNESADVHCPIVEMPTRSKLSCLSWNKSSKNIIASSDYEGIVTVWDINTRQSVMEYEEHEKRAWSVDFSHTEPSMLVSGSDDCKVKVWSAKQEASVFNIDMKANICCVKYNPCSSIHVAAGSADHNIHYFDLRNTSAPVHVFRGHKKTVSYVKFLSADELASASTDSTLCLWDVKDNTAVRTFKGHTNEKNFVGLTASNEYIACGSETNDVYVYHKAISKPTVWHRFGSPDLNESDDDPGSYFISALCWKSDSPTMLAASSQGTIKVLTMAT